MTAPVWPPARATWAHPAAIARAVARLAADFPAWQVRADRAGRVWAVRKGARWQYPMTLTTDNPRLMRGLLVLPDDELAAAA